MERFASPGLILFQGRRLHRLLKKLFFVILGEAKNLSLFLFLCLNRREILRFAQNDSVWGFTATSSA
jgi:hypothetical protein